MAKKIYFDIVDLKIKTFLFLTFSVLTTNVSWANHDPSPKHEKSIFFDWENEQTDPHGFDIFGLGRNDLTNLYQKYSKSANYGAVAAIATDNDFSSLNEAPSRTGFPDLEFLMLSSNGVRVDSISKDVDLDEYSQRSAREWLIQSDGFSLPVFLNFQLDNPKLYRLIADTDADFTSGYTDLGSLDADGTIEVANLDDYKYMTLAYVSSPGGIGDDLQVWLKANKHVSTINNGDVVSVWDNYGPDSDATNTLGSTPIYISDSTSFINFNPIIQYDGNDLMTITEGMTNSSETYNNIKTFAVSRFNASEQTAPIFSEKNASNDNNFELFYPFHTLPNQLNVKFSGGEIPDGEILSPINARVRDININSAKLSVSPATKFLRNDGIELLNSSTVPATIQGIDDDLFIGGDATSNYIGDLAEIIIYTGDTEETNTQFLQIESYLAIKYGITLGNSNIGQEYLSAKGETVWAVDANFHNDVFGLAYQKTSCLDQRISKSINPQTILTLATTADYSSPNDASRQALTNGQYLMVGNNGENVLDDPAFAPVISGINYQGVNRVWKASNFDDIGNVNLGFNLRSLLTAYSSNPQWYLMVSSSPNMTSPTPVLLTELADKVFSVEYNFASNTDTYFSIARKIDDEDDDLVEDTNDYDWDNDGIPNHIESPNCFLTTDVFERGERDNINIYSDLSVTGVSFALTNALKGDLNTYAAKFSSGQNLINKTVLGFDFPVPIKVNEIKLKVSSPTLIFETNKVAVEVSDDKINWFRAGDGGTLTNNGGVDYNTFVLGTLDLPFRYYRIQSEGGIINDVEFEVEFEIEFADNLYIGNDACSDNEDNDAFANHADLDSDDDGCSDFIEAGLGKVGQTVVTEHASFAGYGVNGLADFVEITPDGLELNYIPALSWVQDDTKDACDDDDSDEVLNIFDIDDDNDGIPDNLEYDCKESIVKNESTDNAYNAVGSFLEGNIEVDNTVVANYKIDFIGSLGVNSSSDVEVSNGSLKFAAVSDADHTIRITLTKIAGIDFSEIKFGPNIDGNPLGSSSIENNTSFNFVLADLTSARMFDVGNQTNLSDGTNSQGRNFQFLTTSTQTVDNSSWYFLVQNRASQDQLVFDLEVKGASGLNSYSLNMKLCDFQADYDLDSKPNHLDLDSDDDGCFDAKESGHDEPFDASGQLSGVSGVNGLDASVEDADVLSPIITYTLLAFSQDSLIDFCLDNDNDGIADALDIDDDNDGLLDTKEGLTDNSQRDTDKDGVPDHFDLDSDEDGCLDVEEAGHNLAPLPDSTIAGPFGNNGYANNLESDDSFGPTLSFTQSLEAFYIDVNHCEQDRNDLDKDDDGIPDVLEGLVITEDTIIVRHSDNDDIPDFLDLNSDDDSCFDAQEAGHGEPVGIDGRVQGSVGTNGLNDAVEISDIATTTINYTLTSAVINDLDDLCVDTDNDGVLNFVDIDDDNDGLLDVLESGTCTFNNTPCNVDCEEGRLMDNFVNWASGGTTANGEMDQDGRIIDVEVVSSEVMTLKDYRSSATSFSNCSNFCPVINASDVDLHKGVVVNAEGSYTITFSEAVNNPRIFFQELDGGVSLNFTNQILPIITTTNHTLTATSISSSESIGTAVIELVGAVTSVSFTVNHNGATDPSFAIQMAGLAFDNGNYANYARGNCDVLDSDKDNIPNSLELDSDGDNCPDAEEGGTGVTLNSDNTIGSDYGSNGLASEVELSDTDDTGVNYSHTYPFATSGFLSTCGDSDGDNVQDVVDIDDDNDGIPDAIEMNCGVAIMSSKNQTTTSLLAEAQFGTSSADVFVEISNGTLIPNTAISNGIGFGVDAGTNQDYTTTITATPHSGSLLFDIFFGPQLDNVDYTESTNNESQEIILEFDPRVSAIVNDPDNQIDNYETGDLITPGDTIIQNGTFNRLALTWSVKFKPEFFNVPFELVTKHSSNTALAIDGYELTASVCQNLDADQDNIINSLDTDSDNDGCFDAFEAGATNSNIEKLTGPFGQNGLANSVEIGDSFEPELNYNLTTFSLNTDLFNKCDDDDDDDDGVINRNDLDIDNDGISNRNEQLCDFNFLSTQFNTIDPNTKSIDILNYNNEVIGKISIRELYPTNNRLFDLLPDEKGGFKAEARNITENGKFFSGYSITIETTEEAQGKFSLNMGGNGFLDIEPNQTSIEFSNNVFDNKVSIETSIIPSINNMVNFQDIEGSIVYDVINAYNGDLIFNFDAFTTPATPATIIIRSVGVPDRAEEGIQFIVNDICTFGLDTDNDGEPNYLDLDSDGDECFDAFESGHGQTDKATGEVSGTVGSNGLLNTLENNDSQTAINNFNVNYSYWQKSDVVGCEDNDDDGVSDEYDLDIDNDGVSNQQEFAYCDDTRWATFDGSTSTDLTTYIGSINRASQAVGVEISQGINVSDISLSPSIFEFSTIPDEYFAINGSVPAVNLQTSNTVKICFDTEVFNPLILVTNAGPNSAIQRLVFNTPIELAANIQNSTLFGDRMVQSAGGNFIVRAIGTHKCIEFTPSLNSSSPANISVALEKGCYGDLHSDADNIPDHLDTDSDGDGCFDTYESGLANSNIEFLSTAVGQNGLADVHETDDTHLAVGTFDENTRYRTIAELDLCQDFDGDGEPNLTDLDNDNDGIPDDLECSDDFDNGILNISGANHISKIQLISPVQLTTYELGRLVDGTSGTGVKFNTDTYFGDRCNFSNPIKLRIFFDDLVDLSTFVLDNDSGTSGDGIENYRLSFYGQTGRVKYIYEGTIANANTSKFTIELPEPIVEVAFIDLEILSQFCTGSGTFMGQAALEISEIAFIGELSEDINCNPDNDANDNRFDTDSDGDGCSDAFEAGHNIVSAPSELELTGTFGQNGLISTVEYTDSDTTSINYNFDDVSFLFNDPSFCKDSDGDGIFDGYDVDDDNDGIADNAEYGKCLTNIIKNGQFEQGSQDWIFADNNGISPQFTTNPSLCDNGCEDNFLILEQDADYTLFLTQNLPNLLPGGDYNLLFEMGASAPSSTLDMEILVDDVVVKTITVSDITASVSSVFNTIEVPFRATQYEHNIQFVIKHTHTVDNNYYLDNIRFEEVPCDYDTDDDGIVDRLDLDSDDDGCIDALESGHGVVAQADSTLAGDVGTNGLVNTLETGDSFSDINNYTISNLTYRSSTEYCTDTDGDSVIDAEDIDLDNDGITNFDECFGIHSIFKNSNFVDCLNGWITEYDNINCRNECYRIPKEGELSITKELKSGKSCNYPAGQFCDSYPVAFDNTNFISVNGTANKVILAQTVDLIPNTNYTLWFTALSFDSDNSNGTIIFVDNNGSQIMNVNIDASNCNINSWKGENYYVTFNTGNTTSNTITFKANGNPNGNQEFIIGNVNLVKGELLAGQIIPICDTDGDGLADSKDQDRDGDGIPDIIESQPTVGLTFPSGNDADNDGLDDAFETINNLGIIDSIDTDEDGKVDASDTDADADGTKDKDESGLTLLNVDVDKDGLDDGVDDVTTGFEKPFGIVDTPASDLSDSDGNANSGGDVDYREENLPPEIISLSSECIENGQVASGNIYSLVKDPNAGQTLSFESSSIKDPVGGLFSIDPSGNYTYTPESDFFGQDSAVVTICDDGSPKLCVNLPLYFSVTESASACSLIPWGNATDNGSCCADLNTDSEDVVGGFWHNDTLNLYADFAIDVKVNFGDKDLDGGNGISIIFQRDEDGLSATGGNGLVGFSNIDPSFAVEIDTRDEGAAFNDIADDHIALIKGGDIVTGTVDAPVCATGDCANIEDGQDHLVTIVWDASSQIIKVYFDRELRVSKNIDLISSVFDDNYLVHWGLTGATGREFNPQSVCVECLSVSPVNIEICGDGIDNDSDGLEDCEDSDCIRCGVDCSDVEGTDIDCFTDEIITLKSRYGAGVAIFEWERESSTGEILGSTTRDSVVVKGEGTYVLKMKADASCDNYEVTKFKVDDLRDGIDILSNPIIGFVANGDCNGLDIDLFPNLVGTDYSYSWITPKGTNVVSDTIKNADPGRYIIHITNAVTGCVLVDSIYALEYPCEENVPPNIKLTELDNLDTEAPQFDVPSDTILGCEVPFDAPPSVAGRPTNLRDNCDPDLADATYIDALPIDNGGSCGIDITIKRTWTAVDACGNSVSKVQTIHIRDISAPTFTVPADVEISCDANPLDLTITGDVTDEADACSPGTSLDATFKDALFNGDICKGERYIERSWRLEDACGNDSIQIQKIIFVDDVAPTFTVPSDIVLQCTEDILDLSITGDVLDESDNCITGVAASYQDSIVAGTKDTVEKVFRIWKTEDLCGNATEKIQLIVKIDDTEPIVVFPEDITINCDEDQLDVDITGNVFAVPDACGGDFTISFVDTKIDSTCPDDYKIVREWTVADARGNELVDTQFIQIQDMTDPIISSISKDATVDCDAVPPVPQLGLNFTAFDNCSDSVEFSFDEIVFPGSCPNSEVRLRLWSVSDSCGNVTNESQKLFVYDVESPTILSLPENFTAFCPEDVPHVDSTSGNALTEDNCSGTSGIVLTLVDEIKDSICPGSFTITRTWEWTDPCGNDTLHHQTIKLEDRLAPRFVLPKDTIVDCATDTDTSVVGRILLEDVDDWCIKFEGEISYSDSILANNCDHNYTIIRKWTVADFCGNSTTQTQRIQVLDTIPPSYILPPNDTVYLDNSCTYTAPVSVTGEPTNVSDLCATPVEITVSFVDNLNNLTGCNNSGSFERIWKFEDLCNNIVRDTQIIFVMDTIAPVFTMPADIVLGCGDDYEDLAITGEASSATDNCSTASLVNKFNYEDSVVIGGCHEDDVVLRIWSIEDDCGNIVVDTQRITFGTNTAPQILTTISDVSVSCYEFVELPIIEVVDDCSESIEPVITNDTILGDCDDYFFVKRKWTVTDDCGLQDSLVQMITVTECQPNISIISTATEVCFGEEIDLSLNVIFPYENPYYRYEFSTDGLTWIDLTAAQHGDYQRRTATAENTGFYRVVSSNNLADFDKDSCFVLSTPISLTFFEVTPPTSVVLDICEGETIEYNGITYKKPGSYTQNLTDRNGCDSILDITVEEHEIFQSRFIVDICEGESSDYVEPDGNIITFSETTIEYFTYTSQDGCDSVIIFDVVAFDTFRVEENVALCHGESYVVGSQTYTTSGIYTDTLLTEDNCDSIIVTNLTIIPETGGIDSSYVCEGYGLLLAGSLRFNEGDYFDTLVNSLGCDSIITKRLFHIPNANPTFIDTTYCFGETGSINGISFTESTVLNFRETAANGCDSIVTYRINYLPEYLDTVMATVCEGEVFNFDTYSSEIFFTDFYTDVVPHPITGCDSTIVYQIEVIPDEDYFADTTICGDGSIVLENSIQTESGVYVDSLVSAATGCDSVVFTSLDIFNLNETSDFAVACDGEVIDVFGKTYTANAIDTTYFQDSNGCDSAVITDVSFHPISDTILFDTICANPNNFVSVGGQEFSTTGIHTVNLLNNFGCDSTIRLDLTVLPIYDTTIFVEMCQGDTLIFEDNELTQTGLYTEFLFSQSGCDSVVTIDLIMHDTFNINETITICEFDSVQIHGLYQFQAGIYSQVYQTVEGCDSTVNVELVVEPKTILSIEDTFVCAGDEVQLIVSGTETAKWSPEEGLSCIDCIDPFAAPFNTMEYIIEAPQCLNDIVRDTVKVEVIELPSVGVSVLEDSIFLFDSTVLSIVVDDPNASLMVMTNRGDTICTNCPNEVLVKPEESTQFIVRATNSFGCYSEDLQNIIVKSECKDAILNIPNFVTYNDDGNNDKFAVTFKGLRSLDELTIFDRWGGVVYASSDPVNEPFDGYLNGKKLQQGVYVCVFKITCLKGEKINITKNVTFFD